MPQLKTWNVKVVFSRQILYNTFLPQHSQHMTQAARYNYETNLNDVVEHNRKRGVCYLHRNANTVKLEPNI